MGYRGGGQVLSVAVRPVPSGSLLVGFFLFQFGNSSLDGLQGALHGIGIGPQHLDFIGLADRIAESAGRQGPVSAGTRSGPASPASAAAAPKTHSKAVAEAPAVDGGVSGRSSTQPPAAAGHGTGAHGSASVKSWHDGSSFVDGCAAVTGSGRDRGLDRRPGLVRGHRRGLFSGRYPGRLLFRPHPGVGTLDCLGRRGPGLCRSVGPVRPGRFRLLWAYRSPPFA